MVSQPVQQGGGELGVPEDLHPLAEGQVGGDEGGTPFVPLRQQVKEQLTAGPVEGHEPEFIHDEQVRPMDLPVQLAQEALISPRAASVPVLPPW